MLLEPELSIIIPVYNEADQIQPALWRLQAMRRKGVEIIVVDGGSSDQTCTLAEPLSDYVIHSEKGRAKQMNAGAASAFGRVILFLHIDTQLPENAAQLIQRKMELPHVWGRFDVQLTGDHFMFRIIEKMMNFRSSLTGVATGDQCIFVIRDYFKQAGTYPDYPLMEDVALSKKLRKISFPVCLSDKAITSSRRWEKRGILKTILIMWWCRWQFFLGVHPRSYLRLYEGS